MRRLVLALAAAAMIPAAPAHAQSSEFVSFGVGIDTGGPPAHVVAADLAVSGGVTVEFSGDRAAGCEAAGSCDVGGVVSWTPASDGTLTLISQERRGHPLTSGFIDLTGFDADASKTLAAVHRGGATCSDAIAGVGDFTIPETTATRGDIALTGADSDVFDTRCPGPLAEDLKSALPQRSVTPAGLKRGRVLDFSGVRSFSAGGLTGAVHSSLRVRVTRVQRGSGDSGDGATNAPFPLRHRLRMVTASYRINEVEGRLPISFSGVPDTGACGPLDSCGLSGRIVLEPRAETGVLTISATAPARRPKRDLLAALGLAHGNRRGVQVGGVGTWTGPGTTSTTNSRGCEDSASLGDGLVDVLRSRRGMTLLYDTFGGAAEGPRSRCAAPLLSTNEDETILATGTVPLREFRLPIGALTLRGGRTVVDDGYSATTTPDVTLGIERLHVRSSTFRSP